VDDFALTPAERRLFRALSERGVRFLVIRMGAALIEGAPLATQDIDVWFAGVDDARIVDGTALRVLPLERVIASKRSTGRLKDTAQLPALEATLLAREKTDER
jgi:hypothetical protein